MCSEVTEYVMVASGAGQHIPLVSKVARAAPSSFTAPAAAQSGKLKKRKDDLPLRARNWIGSIEKSVKSGGSSVACYSTGCTGAWKQW